MYYALSSNIRVIVANAILIRNELFAEGQSKRKKLKLPDNSKYGLF